MQKTNSHIIPENSTSDEWILTELGTKVYTDLHKFPSGMLEVEGKIPHHHISIILKTDVESVVEGMENLKTDDSLKIYTKNDHASAVFYTLGTPLILCCRRKRQ